MSADIIRLPHAFGAAFTAGAHVSLADGRTAIVEGRLLAVDAGGRGIVKSYMLLVRGAGRCEMPSQCVTGHALAGAA